MQRTRRFIRVAYPSLVWEDEQGNKLQEPKVGVVTQDFENARLETVYNNLPKGTPRDTVHIEQRVDVYEMSDELFFEYATLV